MGEPVRLDKWLWAARFFKTRSLAADAIEGGKVQLNGERVKRAKMLQAGDEVQIRRAERPLRLLHPSSRSYFEVLRQKLKWNER